MNINYAKDTVLVVNSLKKNYKSIPCLPYENLSETIKIKHGTIIKFLELKTLGFNNEFMLCEILSNGDIVLVPLSCDEMLDILPSKNKFR